MPETPSVTLVGLSVALQPAGAPVAVRLTMPVNPFTAVTVTVEVAEDPATKVSDVGLAVTVKSVTVTATVAVLDLVPLVPVTVTVKVAGLEQLTVNVEVPEVPRVTLAGLRVAEQPAGAPEAVNDTMPVKPFTAVTVMVDVAEEPATKLIEVGLAATVKSVTVTETVAEWDRVPLVPVTVTVKAAALEQLTVSVDVPEVPRVTLVGLRVAVQPAGAPVAVRLTMPVKPFTAVTVTVDVPEEPATKLMDVGLAVTVKSVTGEVTVTATAAERDNMPLVPVTVTVKLGTALEQLTVNMDVPEVPRVILVGLRVVEQPVGAPVAVKDTTPVKPFTGATVIVEVAEEPAVKLMEPGLAVTVKSATVTATVADSEAVPLVPVTVTVKVAELEQLTVNVDIPDVPRVTLVGLSVAAQPTGAPVAARETIPVNPLTDATVVVEVADEPAKKARDVGLVVTVKPLTVTATVAE